MGNKPTPKTARAKAAKTKKKVATKVSAKKNVLPGKTPKNVVTVDGRDRRPWALASRERLLEAATEEIAAVGFERARLAEIASRADMTPGSVYTWFANKEELFRAALENALGAQVQANLKVLEDVPQVGSEWLLKIASLVPRNAANTDFTPAQKLLVEAYYASWRDPSAREILAPRIREHYSMYLRIIAEAQEMKTVDPALDTHMLATLMLAIPMGMALINMAGLKRPDDIAWLDVAVRIDRALR